MKKKVYSIGFNYFDDNAEFYEVAKLTEAEAKRIRKLLLALEKHGDIRERTSGVVPYRKPTPMKMESLVDELRDAFSYYDGDIDPVPQGLEVLINHND